jgi:hypothetical protein
MPSFVFMGQINHLKIMRIVLLTLALFPAMTAVLHARIGETPDQLVARYGQPLKEEDQKPDGTKIALAKVTFQKGGYQIEVTITGGASQQEVFKKLNGQPITVEETRVLLDANSQGLNWSPPVKTSDSIIWTREDNAMAKMGSDGGLVIRSHQIVTQETAAKTDEARPSLDGF